MYRIFLYKFLTLTGFVHVEVQQHLTPARVSGLSAYQISRANSSGSIYRHQNGRWRLLFYFSHEHHVDLRSTKILPCLFNACYSTSFNDRKISIYDIAYTSEFRFSAILLLMTAIN